MVSRYEVKVIVRLTTHAQLAPEVVADGVAHALPDALAPMAYDVTSVDAMAQLVRWEGA